MKKFIHKKNKSHENIHLELEKGNVSVKIVYSPLPTSSEFLYSIIITDKESNKETKQTIGLFNITKAKYSLGDIIIEGDAVKVVPKKRTTSVYNLHEKDTKVYTFYIGK